MGTQGSGVIIALLVLVGGLVLGVQMYRRYRGRDARVAATYLLLTVGGTLVLVLRLVAPDKDPKDPVSIAGGVALLVVGACLAALLLWIALSPGRPNSNRQLPVARKMRRRGHGDQKTSKRGRRA